MAGKPKDYYKVWKAFVVPAEEAALQHLAERRSQTLAEPAPQTREIRQPAETPRRESGR